MRKKTKRLRHWLLAGGLLAASGALSTVAAEPSWLRSGKEARTARVTIHVARGNWGTANPDDVQRFLSAIADEFQSLAGHHTDEPLTLRVVPRSSSPRVLYERGVAGEYVIQLSARNQNWFQYAYQFAHELCHVYSHFDRKEQDGGTVVSGNQWFEEALCETASLFMLKRLAVAWQAAPPGRQWLDYGPTLAAYADFLLSQPHRRLPAQHSLAAWYRSHATVLRQDPYLREKNELIASSLLSLFEEDPGRWRALAYLNPAPASAAKDFPDFLADWHAACAGNAQAQIEKTLVEKTMVLFGLLPPPARQPAS